MKCLNIWEFCSRQSEVEAYQGVGWYTEPVVVMYAADGRTIYILQSEVEAYEKVGWYREQVVLMYAADGRTRYTLKSEVDAYKKSRLVYRTVYSAEN